jgi:hypothetical protein
MGTWFGGGMDRHAEVELIMHMYWMPLWLLLPVMIVPAVAIADEKDPAIAGFNERLNQVLGSEGGVQVYVDKNGMVGTVIDPPGGERRFTVQPPQSPSMNLGPPLQLHDQPSQLPLPSPPAQPTLPKSQREPR